jgi:N-acetylneuraminic acid mutarotase
MKNKLIVLGGEAINKQFMRDVLVLDLDTMQWSRSPVTLPDPVAGHCAVAVGDSIYYYGGISRQGVYYGTVYRIRTDPSTGEPLSLEEVPTRFRPAADATTAANASPTRPCSREGQTWTLISPTKILMFGGFGLRNGIRDFFNDVHVLDIETALWTKIETTGTAPSPRFYHSASLVGNNKLWIHGGWTGYARENDFYALDLDKLKWKRVVPLNSSKPERDETGEWYDQAWENEQGGEILPRSEHATVVMGKKIIIIGGMGAHFVRDDICIIDTENLTWREVPSECSGEMMPRSGLSASLIDTRIYIIGGHHDFTLHNNVFLLKTERPIERKEVFAQGSFLQDMSFLWENRQFCDLTLLLEGQEVQAHRALLWVRCPYFRSMFSSGMTETKKDRIELEGVPRKYFMYLLEFMYTSQCGPLSTMSECNDDDLDTVKSILILANEFMMEDLVAMCENKLIDIMECSNVVALLELASFYFASTLKLACVNFISNHYDIVSKTMEFEELPAETKDEIKRLKAL